ncbi:hypothetical protein P7K49_032686 [Saguinus oedipus]|uniref:DNA-directed RNA polymerase n=1 Tax=Saguinus oedipus TaxID=9490 RepID=A0ABQ9TPS0_SAGOE|nr:hypothetical protein P7K49_032686 [Saguinus oedipus]
MGSAVEWVTPLGIPIIQPYHKEIKVKTAACELVAQAGELGGAPAVETGQCLEGPKLWRSRKPNKLKQKNGFPPNFIHSLDSTHMMLTALHCYRWAWPGGVGVAGRCGRGREVWALLFSQWPVCQPVLATRAQLAMPGPVGNSAGGQGLGGVDLLCL